MMMRAELSSALIDNNKLDNIQGGGGGGQKSVYIRWP